MGDLTDVESYVVQLQQVEAALLTEPDNEELLKLKADLEEVIKITKELSGEDDAAAGRIFDDNPQGEHNATSAVATTSKPAKTHWKVGDGCMAVSSKNGYYYEAVIDAIAGDQVAVTLVGKKVTDLNKISQLRKIGDVPASAGGPITGAASGKTGAQSKKKLYVFESNSAQHRDAKQRNDWVAEKERRRKKALKKAQRQKTLEEEKEKDKKKWKDFNKKANTKNFKGLKKIGSIFAAPETTSGKVGVGTSGTGGKPMTRFFQQQNKFKLNYSTF